MIIMNKLILIRQLIIILMIQSMLLLNCVAQESKAKDVLQSPTALLLSKYKEKTKLKQRTKALLRLGLIPKVVELVKRSGYGYQVNKLKKDWLIYEDKNYVIICSNIARSDSDGAIMTTVWRMQKVDPLSECVFVELGAESQGKYPKGIIPYSVP